MTLVHRTRAELFAAGWTRRSITAAVRRGDLIRARRDRYLPPAAPDAVVRAVRVGGRLTCLSLLEGLGVFVMDNSMLHVHLPRSASRMRSPKSRRRRLEPRGRRSVRLHWLELAVEVGAATCVDVVDALAHAVLCQAPRAAIATLDSALNSGVIALHQVAEVFALLPSKYSVLRPLIDGRAQSGSESLMRLMLRALGCSVELQVWFDGVGYVDLLVDRWLAIECDSRSHHAGWERQEIDRRRDLALAALGITTIRPTARMIFEEPETVLAAVLGLLRTRAD